VAGRRAQAKHRAPGSGLGEQAQASKLTSEQANKRLTPGHEYGIK